MKNTIAGNIEVLEQVSRFISALDDAEYSHVSARGGSSIGKHVRHILDHYSAVELGLKSGMVLYDARNRGALIESKRRVALEAFEKQIAWLRANSEQANYPMRLRTETSVSVQQQVDVDTCLLRELVYLTNHTVHHLAYMRLLALQQGVQTDAGIGLAPATASYLRSIKAAG